MQVDVLANGSPIGMSPKVDAMAVSEDAISKASLVFDAIYTPPKTKLLKVGRYTLEQFALLQVAAFPHFLSSASGRTTRILQIDLRDG